MEQNLLNNDTKLLSNDNKNNIINAKSTSEKDIDIQCFQILLPPTATKIKSQNFGWQFGVNFERF